MSPMLRRISFRAISWGVWGLLAVGALELGALGLGSGAASAQGAPATCGARDGVLSQLESKYGEVPVAVGVTGGAGGGAGGGGALIEVLTAKDGMTWTIILTTPQGLSCLVASGEGWRPLAPAPEGPSV